MLREAIALTMSQTTRQRNAIRFDTAEFTWMHWAIVALAVVTGAIHLYLFTTDDWIPFLLAGLGFLGAVVLLFVLPDYRKYLYPVGILFTVAQIVGYLLLPLGPLWIGVLDKAVQVLLILLLGYLTYVEWTGTEQRSEATTPG